MTVALVDPTSTPRSDHTAPRALPDFERLLGAQAWSRLPPAVQARFGRDAPGATHVVHEDLGAGRFRFTMHTAHRWFGAMYEQDGIFN